MTLVTFSFALNKRWLAELGLEFHFELSFTPPVATLFLHLQLQFAG